MRDLLTAGARQREQEEEKGIESKERGEYTVKKCPKCGEVNGNSNTACFRCGTIIGPADSYQKICPSCGLVYSSRAERCEKCGTVLAVYSDPLERQELELEESRPSWPYVVAVLVPWVGILIGLIFLGQKEPEAPGVIGTSIAAGFGWLLLFFFLAFLF